MNYSKFFTGEIFSIGGGVSYRSVGLNAAGGEFDAKTRTFEKKENGRITLKITTLPYVLLVKRPFLHPQRGGQ